MDDRPPRDPRRRRLEFWQEDPPSESDLAREDYFDQMQALRAERERLAQERHDEWEAPA